MRLPLLQTLAIGSLAFALAEAADITDSSLLMFQALPSEVAAKDNELTAAKIDLGRQLFFEKRLSKNQDISCNSCHNLAQYGTDRAATSTGHKGLHGSRNAPSVYHAALHIAQFWDGRTATLEDQAKLPVLNPVQMAMPEESELLKVINSIPEYVDSFKLVFPADVKPVSAANFGKAIAAFERKLLTPSRWDEFLRGNKAALSPQEKQGFTEFVTVGCVSCHNGVGVGGHMYQKLGFIKPWPERKDNGRADVTKSDADKAMFKVPSLRNITETAPYLHDGSIAELPKMVQMMAEHQLGKVLNEQQTTDIIAFLKAMKGELPAAYIKEPTLPPVSPTTPKPDPT
jgi:cytochrome c peroxidase